MRTLANSPLLLRALQAAVLNTVIALGIALFTQRGFGASLIYAQCIGMSIWALTDFGRLWLIRDWNSQWRRLVLLVPLGVVIGYLLGTLIADALLGARVHDDWTAAPARTAGFLLMSLTAGVAVTYYFLSRQQLAHEREALEAARRQAAEAQLKLLETQLEPHMLFNTLANLRALIGSDPARATDMLDRLVAYLRATLVASRATTHPLRAEFDRLRDYLELMAVRMGPRLHYTLDLPPALADLQVPTLLLQPLVENSIRHGLEPRVEGGRLGVRAQRMGSVLTLEVSDTGSGPGAATGNATGFGLTQVRERLLTAFGPQAALELIATQGTGTRAVLTIPCPASPA
jgi:signal transduction histidine kinase